MFLFVTLEKKKAWRFCKVLCDTSVNLENDYLKENGNGTLAPHSICGSRRGVKVYQDNVPFFLAYLTTRLYVGCVCGMIVLLYPLL